jgi:probable phosphoglycerate mutase
MSTEVILCRHGEAHVNVLGLVGGEKTCTGLTDAGREQAACLAARLRAEHESAAPFDVLYSAPRRRVQETAGFISAATGLPVHVEERLAGPRHGEADGRLWPDLIAEFGGAPRSDPDQRILIAGHHETVEASFALMLGLARDSSTRAGFATGHASLTRWLLRTGMGPDTWTLTAFSDQQHLAQAGLLSAALNAG